jgi:uncharacterized iron-regulated protein
MKKVYLYFLLAALAANGFVACDKDSSSSGDEEFEKKEAALIPAVVQYVNNTVIDTYTSLSDASFDLCDALSALKADKTQANLAAAAEAWIRARAYWEKSEAFLFGAVADFGIDPHIDTWPLDETAFGNTISNAGFIASMDADDGDVWAADHLGYALLGFHGIEFILYRDGTTKNVSEITAEELIYAVAVAGDLRNQCVRLEVAWAGDDNVSAEKKTLVEELELLVKPSDRPFFYGENMLNAAKAGSTYRTVADAANAILEGCITISAEVGEIKIGTAYSKEDVNYIESPYSYNSKIDFVNNIRSIANAYLGGANESQRGASVSDYITSVDPKLDTDIKAAINNAIAKIEAIPSPFAQNYASTEAGAAMDACDELTSLLKKAQALL